MSFQTYRQVTTIAQHFSVCTFYPLVPAPVLYYVCCSFSTLACLSLSPSYSLYFLNHFAPSFRQDTVILYRLSFQLGVLDQSSQFNSGMYFLQEYQRTDSAFVSVPHIRGHIVLCAPLVPTWTLIPGLQKCLPVLPIVNYYPPFAIRKMFVGRCFHLSRRILFQNKLSEWWSMGNFAFICVEGGLKE